jgi:beta-galactosidase
VNIYMGHGGTNFGWSAGANHTGAVLGAPGFMPTVTSYDYDAPVGEAGELTEKFHRFREVIGRYAPVVALGVPELLPRVEPQTVAAEPVAPLLSSLDSLSTPIRRPAPEPMERLGFDHGLVHYHHRIAGPAGTATLTVEGVRDIAQVFLDGRPVGVVERDAPDPTVQLTVPTGGADLEILVEPLGRVNYGRHLGDRKGLVSSVRLDHQFLFGWDIRVLTLDDLSVLPAAATPAVGIAFHRAVVELPEPADAFVAVPQSGRNLVWLNGFLLGRLWTDRGPQQTLYAPAPLWKTGANEVIVLDLAATRALLTVEVRDKPDLGPTAAAPTY